MKKMMLSALCLSLGACAFYVRSPADYRKDVRAVLEEKRPEIAACYKEAYEANPDVQGKVTIKFDVERKTGKIVNPIVVTSDTTAPDVLETCVVNSLGGLTLTPPDQKNGEGTFTWDFSR